MREVSQVQTLVVGAGWRVRRFVLPALFLSGVSPARTIILRRLATSDGLQEGVRVTTSLDELDGVDIGLTINCVTAESMLGVQRLLLARWPAAIHFCDTPIAAATDHPDELPHGVGRLYSLEDWAALPNLSALIESIRAAESRCDVRIEHFGIGGHFLAFLRNLCAQLGVEMPALERANGEIVATLRPGWRVLFRERKDLPIAKIFCRTDQRLVEDYFEVEPAGHSNDEILYRVIAGDTIRYRIGLKVVSEYTLDAAVFEGFTPWTDRKNVHELDKLVALTRILGFALGGSGVAPYPYAASAADAIMARAIVRA